MVLIEFELFQIIQNFPYSWFFENREIEDVISNILAWRLDLMDDEKNLLDNINLMIEIIDNELKK